MSNESCNLYSMCAWVIFRLVYEDCDMNLCENGATCQKLAGNYLCFCPLGFNGSLCNEGRAYRVLQYYYDYNSIYSSKC